MKLTVFEATVAIQREFRRRRMRLTFTLIRDLIQSLQSCDQNYLLSAIGSPQFQHEPVYVVFKLRGGTFPPTLLYAVQLVDAISLNYQTELDVPEYIRFQRCSATTPVEKFKVVAAPKTVSFFMPFSEVSTYDLASVIEISSRKQASPRKKTYRERKAAQLRKMLGLDKFEATVQSQNDYFLASYASDLNEFLMLLDQPKIDEHEQNYLIDAYFGVYEADKTDIARLLDDIALPASQFR